MSGQQVIFSFFSGSGFLDLGFEKNGFTIDFGTLKQMSPLDSVGISTMDSKGTNSIKVKTVIVTDNVLDTISTLQGNLAGTVSTVEKGVYTFENEWFYLFCRLTITISSSTNTRLFNDYNGTGSRNPHKTHKTPPQNRSAAGFTYVLKRSKSLIPSGFRA